MEAVDWDPYPLNSPPREAHLTQDYLWAVINPQKDPAFSFQC